MLRYIGDYTEQKVPALSEIASAYSPEWAKFQATRNLLKDTDVYRDVRDRFFQTPGGKILLDIKSAMQKARERLAHTDQKKEPDTAMAARKAAEAAYHQILEKMEADELAKSLDPDNPLPEAKNSDIQMEAWKKLESAQQLETTAEQALYATPEWKQLEELESLEFKAQKAWVGLQEQVLLYIWEHTKTKVDATRQEVLKATSNVEQAQREAIPSASKSPLDEVHLRKKRRIDDVNSQNMEERATSTYNDFIQKSRKFEWLLRSALGIPTRPGTLSHDIPKPNASAFRQALKAWEQSQRDFQAFREQNNPDE